jgi:hypothetical protein
MYLEPDAPKISLAEAKATIAAKRQKDRQADKRETDLAKAAIRAETQRAKLNAKLAEAGLTCVVYMGSQAPSVIACHQGHVFEARGGDAVAGKTACPVCRAIARHDKAGTPSTETAVIVAKLQSDEVAARAGADAERAQAGLRAAVVFLERQDAEKVLGAYERRTGQDLAHQMRKAGIEKHEKLKALYLSGAADEMPEPKDSRRGRKLAKTRPTADALSKRAQEMLQVLGVQVLTTEMARASDPAELRCCDCGHTWQAPPSQVAAQRVGCPLCDGALEKLRCQGCRHEAVYPIKVLRRAARKQAYAEMAEKAEPAKFVQATATCVQCGAGVPCPPRSIRRSPQHLARVKAADDLVLSRIDEDHKAAMVAAEVLNAGASPLLAKQAPAPRKRTVKQRFRAAYLVNRSRKPAER